MKPYLMVWNSAQTDVWQQQLLDYLDTRPEVKNWFVPFLGTILLVADQAQNPSTLSNLIHGRFPTLLLAITPADSLSTNGWMPQKFWDLIREPKSSGHWPDTPPQYDYAAAMKTLGGTLGDLYGKKDQGTLETLGKFLAGFDKKK